jgi:hypothetical protein
MSRYCLIGPCADQKKKDWMMAKVEESSNDGFVQHVSLRYVYYVAAAIAAATHQGHEKGQNLGTVPTQLSR